jgi:hypothetical protein
MFYGPEQLSYFTYASGLASLVCVYIKNKAQEHHCLRSRRAYILSIFEIITPFDYSQDPQRKFVVLYLYLREHYI